MRETTYGASLGQMLILVSQELRDRHWTRKSIDKVLYEIATTRGYDEQVKLCRQHILVVPRSE